jgi:hypothetical protein
MPVMNAVLQALLEKSPESFELPAALKALAGAAGGSRIFGVKTRKLKPEEIRVLKKQGNHCDDWNALRVAAGFDPRRVWSSRFIGTCVLGAFKATVRPVEGETELPSGVYGSTVADSEIGNDCLVQDTGLLSRVVVRRGAVVFRAGAVTGSAGCTFGNGREIPIGIETGGREVAAFAELTIPVAEAVADGRADRAGIEAYGRFVRAYTSLCTVPFAVVDEGAVIRFAAEVRDSYIGPHSVVDGAARVENTAVLSSSEEPARLSDGAWVRNSCVQWGCEVTSMSIVDDSVLCEHSHVERHGKVTASIIGPNTGVAEGEVTSCLLGPFVGFHHQALLIAALWPEGKGNIGYGANVGSNHTSKAPDQEIRCGEGTFFGLGVNIKFPSDFTSAPYSIISTGVDTLPQRLEFPFSLINKPSQIFTGLSPAYNEIFPGWVLSDNIYMVRRNEGKYAKRNKARRTAFDFEVFRPELMDKLVRARDRLRAVTAVREFYTDRDIPGLGKNVMTEKSRLKGLEAYDFHIRHYALSGLYRRLERMRQDGKKPGPGVPAAADPADARWEHERSLLAAGGLAERPLRENLETLSDMRLRIARQVQTSKEKDDSRGRHILQDYAETHPPADRDGFVESEREAAVAFQSEIESLVRFIQS